MFALKGGTAINFFHRNLPRLSVDIDLTYLPINKREVALAGISQGLENVSNRIMKQFPKCEIVRKTLSKTNYTINSDPDEMGVKFQLPFPARVHGFYHCLDHDQVIDIVLYDSDGSTELLSDTYRRFHDHSTTNVCRTSFPSGTADISKDTDYRVVLQMVSANSVEIPMATLYSEDYRVAFGGGSSVSGTERTDAGSWTDSTTELWPVGVIITALDDGAAAGGGDTLAQRACAFVG